MYTSIVVAVDGSEYSRRALAHAKSIAECYGCAIWLVHVYPQTSDLRSYGDFEKLVSKRIRTGQAVLDASRDELGTTSASIEEELLEGPEAEAILLVAKTRRADLIVMGTRGFSIFKGLMLGSVSQKVMHQATCPVMVVP
jgi:nucleotide-binding universal stress UspA family protein